MRIEVVWRARTTLPAGRVEWTGVGAGSRWRAIGQPCEGSWGFERFEPGVPVRDVVALTPPSGAASGTLQLSAVVYLGDDVARTEGGERRLLGPQVEVVVPAR